MFFNNLQKNQPAANVDQQSTIESTPESTLCVELSDEELCAVNGGPRSRFIYRKAKLYLQFNGQDLPDEQVSRAGDFNQSMTKAPRKTLVITSLPPQKSFL